MMSGLRCVGVGSRETGALRLVRAAACAFVLAGAACGGGGSSSTFSSGVAPDKTLGTLTPSELAQICQSANAFSQTHLKEASCRIAGVLLASFTGGASDQALQAACKMAYDQCESGQLDGADGGSSSTTDSCMAPPATCTATVAELESCYNAAIGAINQATAAIPSCASLTQASLSTAQTASNLDNTEEPAACKTVDAKCPGFDVSDMTGTKK